MIINTKGVEIKDTNYIEEAGKYLFKITKFEEDGYNKFKLTFVGNKIDKIDGKFILSDELYTHIENYSLENHLLWKIKILEVALKSPEIYDINHFIGRYVVADVGLREYNGKMYSDIKRWSYSKQNDNLPLIPEAQENTGINEVQSYEPQQQMMQNNPAAIDVEDDKIPF